MTATGPETPPRPTALAVITARGGSKRIPRKNIRTMSNRPLMTWPIWAALNSGVFDEVIVTTDDEEIAEVAREAGATVPFLRPAELADDWTPTVPVVSHAINELARRGMTFEYTCCLYPAAIFLSGDDIREMRNKLVDNDTADFLVTVTEFAMPIELALDLDDAGRLSHKESEAYGSRTQDLPTRYHDVGQLYWGKTQSWLTEDSVYTNAIGHVLPKWRAQDIDTEDDWKRAQLLHTIWLEQN